MRVFLLVDVVLVLVLAVVATLVLSGALRGMGTSDGADAPGASPTTPAPASTPAGTAGPTPTATTAAPALGSFATQTRNIACTMGDEGVRCTIASITFAWPGAETCAGTVGHVVVGSADGVEVPCVEGPAPGPAGADVPVLEYGLSSAVGGWTCTSATNGVTCVEDASGAGFRLARAELVEVG